MRVFVTGVKGQLGYDVMNELEKQGLEGIGVDIDETQKPLLQWRSHGNILYSNWLNYYVYQEVPYEFINNREIIGK